MNNKIYYLFGSEITDTYLNEDIEKVYEQAKEGADFDLFLFDEMAMHPSDLLAAFDGWGGFAQITHYEYDKLKAIQETPVNIEVSEETKQQLKFAERDSNKEKQMASYGELHVVNEVREKWEQMFPNTFQNWVETHHVIATELERIINNHEEGSWPQKLYDIQANGGTGGVWELAQELTDQFEQEHKGREWDGEYFDAIEEFITRKLK